MTHLCNSRLLLLLSLTGMLILPSGCEKSEPAKATRSATGGVASGQPEVEAKLASADALDGKVDKVISRCAACALGMDGSSEHALETHGYTMHFCSSHCRDGFAENPDKAILGMKVPAK